MDSPPEKQAIRGRSKSPSPPGGGRRSCFGQFRFRATARNWLMCPSVGENGKRGILKVKDWAPWRIKNAALPPTSV